MKKHRWKPEVLQGEKCYTWSRGDAIVVASNGHALAADCSIQAIDRLGDLTSGDCTLPAAQMARIVRDAVNTSFVACLHVSPETPIGANESKARDLYLADRLAKARNDLAVAEFKYREKTRPRVKSRVEISDAKARIRAHESEMRKRDTTYYHTVRVGTTALDKRLVLRAAKAIGLSSAYVQASADPCAPVLLTASSAPHTDDRFAIVMPLRQDGGKQ